MTFILDLTQVRGQRNHVDRRFSPSAFEPGHDEFSVVSDVSLSFDIEKDGARYRLTGSLQAVLELPCSRCLEPMAWPVDTAFDVRYVPALLAVAGAESELADEDLGTAFYEGGALDLGQLVREQFYLALPMKPLCRVDCLGLCADCGVNRNIAQCQCAPRWVDPRLAVLKSVVPKGGSEPSH